MNLQIFRFSILDSKPLVKITKSLADELNQSKNFPGKFLQIILALLVQTKQENRAVARKPRDAAAVLFG